MADATVLGGVRDRLSGGRQRGPLAAVAVVVLTLAAVGLAPPPAGWAAVGTVPDSIPVFVGVLVTDETLCTVTLVRPWMAITPKHCGTSNPVLKVGVTSRNEDNPDKKYEARKIVQHSSLDVQMLYLYRTAPWNTLVPWGKGSEYDPGSGEPLRVWGFGLDRHNTLTDGLRMAAFPGAAPCPAAWQVIKVTSVSIPPLRTASAQGTPVRPSPRATRSWRWPRRSSGPTQAGPSTARTSWPDRPSPYRRSRDGYSTTPARRRPPK